MVFIVGISFSMFYGVLDEPGRDQDVLNEEDAHISAVVSSHNIPTDAGMEVLERGGTAADAAVAVAASLSVVEPWFSSSLGGGTWALYYDAENDEVTSLDAVGPVGSRASISDYRGKEEERGMHQATVPGAWDGWMLWLDRYGNLGLDEVLAPAITTAREGYPVSPQMDFWFNRLSDKIMSRPLTRAIYAPSGVMHSEGDIIHQHDMADTFEGLVGAYMDENDRENGIQAARDHFYRGPVASSLVEFSDLNGGYLTLDDFAEYEAEIVDPISIMYNDEIEVFQNPPNSQGITMLLALNFLKDHDLSSLEPDDADAVHLQVEAMKLAFADRYHHVGDPDRIPVPVEELLSRSHTDRQSERIDMNRALSWPIPDVLDLPEESHTTTFHIVDRYGNAAAVTTSLGDEFLVVGDTGIHINNRMRMLSLEEENANQLTPGYKVRHTSNPYMAFRDGRPYIVGGNTGVDMQSQGQVQQFLNVVEFDFSAQGAIDHPRFVTTAFPATTPPYEANNVLHLEPEHSPQLESALRAKGHNVMVGGGIVGIANMLVLDSDGEDVDIGAESRTEMPIGRKESY